FDASPDMIEPPLLDQMDISHPVPAARRKYPKQGFHDVGVDDHPPAGTERTRGFLQEFEIAAIVEIAEASPVADGAIEFRLPADAAHIPLHPLHRNAPPCSPVARGIQKRPGEIEARNPIAPGRQFNR